MWILDPGVCGRVGREQVNFSNSILLIIRRKTVVGAVFSPLSNLPILSVNVWIVQKQPWLSQDQRVRSGSQRVELHIFMMVPDEHLYRFTDM